MNFDEFANISLTNEILPREKCRQVLNCSDEEILALLDATYKVRRHYYGNTVHIQVLTNAKSGFCQEDCHYCSQSKISTADIDKYPMMSKETLLKEASRAKQLKAKRYCMALSGRGPSDREIDDLCGIISAIKEKTKISVCCSLGLLKEGQAERLKAAGLDRVNHNLNTSENFHPQICTTHTYQETGCGHWPDAVVQGWRCVQVEFWDREKRMKMLLIYFWLCESSVLNLYL